MDRSVEATDIPRSHLWVVGSSGLLGTAVLRQARDMSTPFEAGHISWSAPAARDQLRAAARRFMTTATEQPRIVVWCAGAGVIGTSSGDLGRETEFLEVLLDEVGSERTTFFLASSAGGVFGAGQTNPIHERTAPNPISEYGKNKVRQERMVAEWSAATGGRSAVGRIANLYGPGQRLEKRQGLISQTCWATLTRHPVSVYVSLDTLRDYVYVDDAAAIALAMTVRACGMGPGTHTMKIIGSGSSVSIGGVLGEVQRVLRRSPNLVMAPSSKAALQGSALSFRSEVWTDLDRLARTPLPAGIHATVEHLRAQMVQSSADPLRRSLGESGTIVPPG